MNEYVTIRLADGEELNQAAVQQLRDVKVAQEQRIEQLRAALQDTHNTLANLRRNVREVFRSIVDDSQMDLEDANDRLAELGLRPLPYEFEWYVQVTIRGTAKGPDPDEVENILREATVYIDPYPGDEVEIEQTDVDWDDVEVSNA